MKEAADEVIKKAQKGDKAAFEELAVFYRQFVANVCYKYMHNEEDALEIAQEVFYNVYKGIKSFKFGSKFSTWLYRMTLNLCFRRMKQNKKEHFYIQEPKDTGTDAVDEREVVADKKQLQDKAYETKTAIECLYSVMESYSEEERKILVLREMEELSHEEIAGIMGLSVSAVKIRIFRAKERLRNDLKRRFKDGL